MGRERIMNEKRDKLLDEITIESVLKAIKKVIEEEEEEEEVLHQSSQSKISAKREHSGSARTGLPYTKKQKLNLLRETASAITEEERDVSEFRKLPAEIWVKIFVKIDTLYNLTKFIENSLSDYLKAIFEVNFWTIFKRRMEWKDTKKSMYLLLMRRAARYGYNIIIKILLKKDFWEVDELILNSYLLTAIEYGHVEAVKLFLEDGHADPTAHYSTSVNIAMSYNKSGEIMGLLLKDGRVDVNNKRPPVIEWASIKGYPEITKLLLDYGSGDNRIDPTVNESSPLIIASADGYEEVVVLLLKDGRSDPRAKDSESIREASGAGFDKVVELLLKDGRADPNDWDNQSIRVASDKGHDKVVELLLKDGRANPRADFSSSIKRASRAGYSKVVKLLLDDGRANPAINANAAIRWASERGHEEVVKLLLADVRVDPAAQNNYAIRKAIENKHEGVVKLLKNSGSRSVKLYLEEEEMGTEFNPIIIEQRMIKVLNLESGKPENFHLIKKI